MVDASIDLLCSAIIAACAGCTYTGDYMLYMPATYNDYWVCGYIPPFSSHKQWSGGPQPHCAEPNFVWSSYGGGVDWNNRPLPSGVCWNVSYGAIVAYDHNPNKVNCCNDTGNPINSALGIKTHRESVFSADASLQPLRFEWLYSTHMDTTVAKTAGWSHTFSRVITETHKDGNFAFAYREDGYIAKFTLTGGVYVTDADVNDRLTRNVDGSGNTTGWTYYVAGTDDTEAYDAKGKLLSIQSLSGATLLLTYSDANTPPAIALAPDLLIRVTDALGRQL
jgi:hypothetical protein